MPFLMFILRAVLFWVALIAAGFAIFLSAMPGPVLPHDVSGDAIVVVTGGSGRVGAGVALLQVGRAPKLFISGVGKGVRLQDLMRQNGIPADIAVIYAPQISLGHQATNTVENGEEIAAWVRSQHISRIILVSSPYHIMRAELEVLMAAPGLKIQPFVSADADATTHWWRQRWTVDLMLREYMKTAWVGGQYITAQIKSFWNENIAPVLKAN